MIAAIGVFERDELLAELAVAGRQLRIDLAEEEGGEFRAVAQEFAIVRPVDLPAANRCEGPCGGAARIAADHAEFADQSAFTGNGEHSAAAFVVDLDLATRDEYGKVTLIALAEDDLVFRIIYGLDMAEEGIEVVIADADAGVLEKCSGKILA